MMDYCHSKLTYLPTSAVYPLFLSDGMVRFNDPGVVERDFGLYSLALGSWIWSMESLTNHSLNSSAQEFLAHHKWPLHVSVLCYVGLSPSFPLPDGST